ncbi:MAG: TFIIB-type zinc ribbon-containing protein [Haloarculaceae archaeon]
MKVRGERECTDCGTRWSYYETGSIACPDCGSIRSVGVDDRTRHTDAPATLDLTPVRSEIDTASTREVAERAADICAEYVRKRGFIDAGDLRPLDEVYVAAVELRHVAGELTRELRPTEQEELYFLDLLRGADDGQRPAVEEVPDSLSQPYGLAMAAAVEAYTRDLRTHLDDHPDEEARRFSGRIRDHRKRIEALDGDVDPADANRLLHAARDLGKYVIEGEESALVTADNWLSGIDL